MRFSKDKIHELKEKVRFEMVKNPNISILELQVVLRNDYGHRFDKNFIGKLKRKVHRERTIRLDFASVSEELAKLEDLYIYGKQELMKVIFNDDGKYKPSEIISAFKTVIWAGFTLFDAKLNAGIFDQTKRKQEREKPLTPEEQETVNRAISMVTVNICDKCADSHYQEKHEKEATTE